MVTNILRDAGLLHYAARFEEEGVTADMLGSLSESDLKELGVNKLGHRRAILQLARKPPQQKQVRSCGVRSGTWLDCLRLECDRGVAAQWTTQEVGPKDSRVPMAGFVVLDESELLRLVCPRARTFKSFCSKCHQFCFVFA